MNWYYFKNILNDNLQLNFPLKTAEDIEKAVQKLDKTIQNAAWKSTPEEKPKTKCPEYPGEIKGKITEKRRLRRVWQHSRQPEDKRRFHMAVRQLKDMIQKIKNDTFEEYQKCLTATDDTDYSHWRARKRQKQSTRHISPIRNED
jgi:hypothetical protein